MRLAIGAVLASVGAFALFFLLADGPPAGAGWEQVASMSQRRSYIASTQVGDEIYAAGGMVGDSGRPLATFSRYDARADRWQNLPALPVATRAAAAAAVDGVVYVIGGTTNEGNTAAVWAWDGESWSPRAPLPSPRFNHAAVALDGEIYVLGGFREGVELREVLVYDPQANRWRSSAPLPRPNHAFGVVAFRGELWTIGGRRGEELLREVEIFDPRGGGWRAGPAMPKPMELLGAAVVGDEIHAVWESTYQILDTRSGAWRDGPTPGVTRHALKLFHIGERALHRRRLHDGAPGQPDRRAPPTLSCPGAGAAGHSCSEQLCPARVAVARAPRWLGDHDPLHLVRALADLEDLLVAVEARDRVLVHVAVAAVDLQRPVDGAVRELAGVELRHRGLAGERPALVLQPRGLVARARGPPRSRSPCRRA